MRALVAGLLALGSACAQAGATFDGSTCFANCGLTGPSYAIRASQGQTLGANLFHSFSVFSLTATETALFSNDTAFSIGNVISRVTGGAISTIDGTIRSTIPGANFYFINPAGVVFGRTAVVNVLGAFTASTASYLRFTDGVRFDATSSAAPLLTSAQPEAFGFVLGAAPGEIRVKGATLQAPSSKGITLIGGDITLQADVTPATIRARSGDLSLISAQSPGEVLISGAAPDASALAMLGTVSVNGGATLDVSNTALGSAGGRILIRAGRIVLADSTLDASTKSGNSRGIDLSARDSFTMTGGNVLAVTTGAGNAGSIQIAARSAAIGASALIDTSCDPGCSSGNGGALSLNVQETLQLSGPAGAGLSTGIVSNTFGGGRSGAITIAAKTLLAEGDVVVQSASAPGVTGNAGNLTVSAETIDLAGGAQLDSSTRSSGAAGAVSATAQGTFTIRGTHALTGNPSGVFSNTESSGNAGTVTVSAARLSVESGGEISSSSRTGATGRGGTVTVTAQESLIVDGASATGKRSGIVTNTFTGAPAGAVQLSAPRVEIRNGALIQSQSQGAGAAGQISLDAGALSISDGGQISSDARDSGVGGAIRVSAGDISVSGFGSGLFTNAYSVGPGGSIIVTAGTLSLSDQGGLFANTIGSGKAGDISIAAGAQSMTGGIIASDTYYGGGSAGNILVNAGTLQLSDAQISASTFGPGAGGNVTIRATEGIRISGQVIGVEGGGFFSTSGAPGGCSFQCGSAGSIVVDAPAIYADGGIISSSTFSDGRAGNVDIRTGALTLTNGALASTSTFSAGNAGSVTIQADRIDISAGSSQGTFPSGIYSSTAPDSSGNAGAISVTAGTIGLSGGLIASASLGTGNGANVSVRGAQISLQNGGKFSADTALSGSGGSVDVIATGTIDLAGTSPLPGLVGGPSGLFARTTGSGDGGAVMAQATTINLREGAAISASSTGTGHAGGISVIARDTLRLDGGSVIATEAFSSDGGNIDIRVGNLIYLKSSAITTAVGSGFGSGGNIFIDPVFLVLSSGQIIANAFGGNGGNITIVADNIFMDPASQVTASSQLGLNGTIRFSSPVVDLSGNLATLPGAYLDVAALLASRCGAKLARGASSLIVARPGGLPFNPDAYVPVGALAASAVSGLHLSQPAAHWWSGTARTCS